MARVPVVLVVDDEPLIRLSLACCFRDDGWDVLEASSGEEAIAKAAGRPIDVLFTDIQLNAALDGWEVARAFVDSDPGIKIIYGSGAPPDEKLRLPGSLFVSKPYDFDAVVLEARKTIVAQS